MVRHRNIPLIMLFTVFTITENSVRSKNEEHGWSVETSTDMMSKWFLRQLRLRCNLLSRARSSIG